MHLYAGRTNLTHFVQYLIAFCGRPEVVSNVISCVAIDRVRFDVLKLGDSRSNRSRNIRAAHFVIDDECRTPHAAERRHRQTRVIT